jgi:DNA polymerase (family 10)
MKNPQVAGVFHEIADLLELKGDNPFRVRAYRRAAMNVEAIPKDVAGMSEAELQALPGIGKDLAHKIRQYVESGRIDVHEELQKEIPRGLLELLRVPGIGPKTARLLYDRRGVSGVRDLETLAREGKLAGLPGIQAKTEENIRKGIEQLRKGTDRFPLGKALPVARGVVEMLRDAVPGGRYEIAGSIRRWKETVRDIDILAAGKKPEAISKAFVGMPGAGEVLERGTTKSSILTAEGIQVDLRVVAEESFGAALQYFTGSKEHNVRLREMASRRGLKLNEYGVFREPGGRKVGGREEEDIYRALGLPFIPPEIREDQGEIEAALEGKLPELLALADIRGDLHVHTKWSDGAHGLSEIVAAAGERKYGYVAITDHSKGLGVARGLTEERVREQIAEIDAANRKTKGFRILKGIEVDIRGDGTLDLPDALLRDLDIVVASIHSGFRQPGEQLTKRLVAAIRNPYVHVIAHPTGRLLGEREAYPADMDAVLAEAARCGKAMEINAHPLRMDLSDANARAAKRLGVPLVVSTDTHVLANLDYMGYGVSIARRGWLTRGDVLNTLPFGTLSKRLQAMRGKGG